MPCSLAGRLLATPEGRRLAWQRWDGIYLVYQPSSAETHVFNETTALILRSLEKGPLFAKELKQLTEDSLGIEPGGLGADEFEFATSRLEELGLIDCLDEALAVR
ncbi:MAG: HPr-rel-A system PqqD family peptide chaperone [Candidatus Accumulibacter sp. UW26]|jgi:PqqD family protein of HPr-rel-A system